MSQDQAVIIPSDPETRKKLKAAVVDISDQMEIIAGHRANVKTSVEAVAEEFELPKKFIRKMVRTYFAQNFNAAQAENEDFVELFEAVFDANKTAE